MHYMFDPSLVLACYFRILFISYDIILALLLTSFASSLRPFYTSWNTYTLSPIFNSLSLVLQITTNILLNTLPSLSFLWIHTSRFFIIFGICLSCNSPVTFFVKISESFSVPFTNTIFIIPFGPVYCITNFVRISTWRVR